MVVARPKKEGQIKLTVSLPETLSMKAKIYAIENRMTLSGLIEKLLRERLNMQDHTGEKD